MTRALWLPLNIVQLVISFAGTGLLIALALLLMLVTRNHRLPLWMARHVWARFILGLLGARVRIEYTAPLPDDGDLLFVANHQSAIDIRLNRCVSLRFVL